MKKIFQFAFLSFIIMFTATLSQARNYDPQKGIFLQEDPVWKTNLYIYGQNNPVNMIDPFGMDDIFVSNNNGKTVVQWRDDQGKTVWTRFANSGIGEGMNNPKFQYKSNLGPTMEGKYFIDLSNNAAPDKTLADGEGWGLYGWRLNESLGTRFKRKLFTDRSGNFHIHQDAYGNSRIGTLGCIGLLGEESILTLKTSLENYSQEHETIKVIVDY